MSRKERGARDGPRKPKEEERKVGAGTASAVEVEKTSAPATAVTGAEEGSGKRRLLDSPLAAAAEAAAEGFT
jgi:hypothetical protein